MTGVKYTGKDLEITVGSTAIPCANIRSINVDEKLGLADTTGACDQFMTYLTMRRDVDVAIELLDSTDPTEVYNLFGGLSDTLIVYPQGNHAGKPKLTCTAFTITGRSRPIKYTDAVLVNVTGKGSGGFAAGTV